MSILVSLVALQFQCGAGADYATFDVYVNDQLLNESIVVEQIESISIAKGENAQCAHTFAPLKMEVSDVDDLPNVGGLYEQVALRDYTADLKDSETIILYELGTRNTNYADWQDVVLRVDYAYTPVAGYPAD